MGCNCGKKRPSPRAAGVAADGSVDSRPHIWRVHFPNGAKQDFQHEWQANAARAAGGGERPEKIYTR